MEHVATRRPPRRNPHRTPEYSQQADQRTGSQQSNAHQDYYVYPDSKSGWPPHSFQNVAAPVSVAQGVGPSSPAPLTSHSLAYYPGQPGLMPAAHGHYDPYQQYSGYVPTSVPDYPAPGYQTASPYQQHVWVPQANFPSLQQTFDQQIAAAPETHAHQQIHGQPEPQIYPSSQAPPDALGSYSDSYYGLSGHGICAQQPMPYHNEGPDAVQTGRYKIENRESHRNRESCFPDDQNLHDDTRRRQRSHPVASASNETFQPVNNSRHHRARSRDGQPPHQNEHRTHEAKRNQRQHNDNQHCNSSQKREIAEDRRKRDSLSEGVRERRGTHNRRGPSRDGQRDNDATEAEPEHTSAAAYSEQKLLNVERETALDERIARIREKNREIEERAKIQRAEEEVHNRISGQQMAASSLISNNEGRNLEPPFRNDQYETREQWNNSRVRGSQRRGENARGSRQNERMRAKNYERQKDRQWLPGRGTSESSGQKVRM